ncbi:MAG: hypothetical protein K8S24_06280 [Candidatus Aegiribacteria sp.]|nr:hypothetical protein [Candidatus Aegiribacteria sp.]
MLNLILAVLVPFLVTTAEEQTASNIEVVEIFRAETTEELEASLTDGYPMPWLEEILNDESIPEEDRYWLDCRVRAVIAQDLHLFYDEEGSPVYVDADWIVPGENYWRENFIVNPVGEPFVYNSPDMPTHVRSEPGFIVNRFGEEIGQLALTNRFIRLSRDGTIGVTCSDVQLEGIVAATSRATNVCILYPDGSFIEIPIGYSAGGNYAISNDGNTIVAASYLSADSTEYPEEGGILWILDRDGNIRKRFETSTHPCASISPAVSANGKYVACQQYPSHSAVYLLEGETGELLHRFEDNIVGNNLHFAPNERYLCVGGYEWPLIFDCDNLREVWSMELTEDFIGNSFLNCDNSAQLIAIRMSCITDPGTPAIFEQHLYRINENNMCILGNEKGSTQLSPNGSFTLSHGYLIYRPLLRVPLIINQVNGGE